MYNLLLLIIHINVNNIIIINKCTHNNLITRRGGGEAYDHVRCTAIQPFLTASVGSFQGE